MAGGVAGAWRCVATEGWWWWWSREWWSKADIHYIRIKRWRWGGARGPGGLAARRPSCFDLGVGLCITCICLLHL